MTTGETPDKRLSRRKAREQALIRLYQQRMGQDEPEPLPDDPLVRGIVGGVLARGAEFDLLLGPHLVNWTIDRLAQIDHIILQMGLCEMLELKTAPRVVIDEAIELCKLYSTPESTGFINGVLDAVMKEQGLGGADEGTN